jgi:hypothetical protein
MEARSMTRKRRYLICVAALAACVGIVIGVLAMLPPQPRLTKANLDRIKKGMTLKEAEAILGEPSSVKEFVDPPAPAFQLADWTSNNGRTIVQIVFDDKGAGMVTTGGGPDEETFLEMLRRWLHLPK